MQHNGDKTSKEFTTTLEQGDCEGLHKDTGKHLHTGDGSLKRVEADDSLTDSASNAVAIEDASCIPLATGNQQRISDKNTDDPQNFSCANVTGANNTNMIQPDMNEDSNGCLDCEDADSLNNFEDDDRFQEDSTDLEKARVTSVKGHSPANHVDAKDKPISGTHSNFKNHEDLENKLTSDTDDSAENNFDPENKYRPDTDDSAENYLNPANKHRPATDDSAENYLDPANKHRPDTDDSAENYLDPANKHRPGTDDSAENYLDPANKHGPGTDDSAENYLDQENKHGPDTDDSAENYLDQENKHGPDTDDSAENYLDQENKHGPDTDDSAENYLDPANKHRPDTDDSAENYLDPANKHRPDTDDSAENYLDQENKHRPDTDDSAENYLDQENKHRSDTDHNAVNDADSQLQSFVETQTKDFAESVFLTETADIDDEDSISEARADTPPWDGSTNALDDGGSLFGSDDPRLPHQNEANRHRHRAPNQELHTRIPTGLRPDTNTPASYCNMMTDIQAQSRSPFLGQKSYCEAAVEHAMTLMSDRCVSGQDGRDGQESGLNLASYRLHTPEYFYVKQQRPVPMAPLKVWKGYNGNVYFEPIQIKSVNSSRDGRETTADSRNSHRHLLKSSGSNNRSISFQKSSQRPSPNSAQHSHTLVSIHRKDRESRVGGGELVLAVPSNQHPSRSTTRLAEYHSPASAKSFSSSVAAISQHHVLILDKQAVMNPNNANMHEELQVIEGLQSTGSLAFGMQNKENSFINTAGIDSRSCKKGTIKKGTKSVSFDRVCKGSVAQQLSRARTQRNLGDTIISGKNLMGNTFAKGLAFHSPRPGLMVVGDKFAPPATMSPLLRTQTQFSLSSQRMTMNTPDLYSAFEHLPPLEQIRISLRHMDSRGSDDPYQHRVSSPYNTMGSIGILEDLKPLIKYSPEIKAQYNRQLKYF